MVEINYNFVAANSVRRALKRLTWDVKAIAKDAINGIVDVAMRAKERHDNEWDIKHTTEMVYLAIDGKQRAMERACRVETFDGTRADAPGRPGFYPMVRITCTELAGTMLGEDDSVSWFALDKWRKSESISGTLSFAIGGPPTGAKSSVTVPYQGRIVRVDVDSHYKKVTHVTYTIEASLLCEKTVDGAIVSTVEMHKQSK